MSRRSALSMTFALLATSAFAQDGGGFTQRPSARALPAPPELSLGAIALPEPAPRGNNDVSPSAGTMFLQEVRFSGVTALSEEDLTDVVSSYLNRRISSAELLALRQALTRVYVDAGYITSGFVLPDQDPTGGVLRFQAVEGALGDIIVEGVDRVDASYVEEGLTRGLTAPLNASALRDAVIVLLRDPAIEGIDATLRPSGRPGFATLFVRVTEPAPILLSGSFGNEASPSIGSLRGEFRADASSAFTSGDLFTVAVQGAEGLRAVEVGYEAPFFSPERRVFAGVRYSNADVVTGNFRDLDIQSETLSANLGLSHTFIRTPTSSLVASISAEFIESRTRLLGRPFPFSPGVGADGVARVAPVRLVLEYVDAGPDQVISLRSTASVGLSVLGAERNSGGRPDGRYVAWLGQAAYERRLTDAGLTLGIDAALQLTPDRLLPIEQFGVGGLGSVRGYRANRFVRDNGMSGSIELSAPVYSLAVPGLSQSAEDGTIEGVGFLDFGKAWDNAGGPNDNLASVGAGLRWKISDTAAAEFYAAQPLIDQRSASENDLQDIGIHFRLNIGFQDLFD